MTKFYDSLTERWYQMPTPPAIDRPKPPTVANTLSDKTRQNLRISEHAHIWQAIEATATATQMSQEVECPVESIP